MLFFGIDISKLTFDVTIVSEKKPRHKKYKNSPSGFEEFLSLIKSYKSKAYYCMEATGVYGMGLAQFLVKNKLKTIVANPYKIKNYSRMKMNRNKTDKADSLVIASYCKSLYLDETIENNIYKPKSKYYQRLQSLVTRLEQVKLLKTQEVNHLESTTDVVTVKFINMMIKQLNRQIKLVERAINDCVSKDKNLTKEVELLISIDGISYATAWAILAYLGDISLFENSGQVTSYVGINPCIEDSGTTLKKARLSKMGHKRLRKALYMPAIVAKKHNPILLEFYERLLAKGKPKKVALCAVMRKLLVLSFGVLKSGIEFDPNYRKEKAS